MIREQSHSVVIGRYALYDEIASGGMATVHIGRLLGPVGFSRTVAIKRMHPNLAKDPEFVSMFLDEARLAARIRHPNVIGTLDVVALAGELFLVMEYVHGESLFRLMKTERDAGRPIPLPIVSAIMVGVLDGLHAAHEATNEREEPLGIVHRDVSPHNVIVGAKDGLARVLDFGIAKAADRAHSTRDGQIKGKLSYMAPEQLQSGVVDRTSDVYAASVILWECLAGARLVPGESELRSMVSKVLSIDAPPPSRHAKGIPPELDALVLRGLEKEPSKRIPTAREMARSLQKIAPAAPASDVAEWVESVAGTFMGELARRVAIIEQATPTHRTPSLAPPAPPPAPASRPQRTSENPTVVEAATPARRGARTKYFVVGGVALTLVVGSVILAAASSGPRPGAVSAASAASATGAAPQGLAAQQATTEALVREPTTAGVEPSAEAPVVAVPASTTKASNATAPAKRTPTEAAHKRAAARGEFDHVMDSRK